MYTQGCPVEIQTPTHWNQISSTMTAQPPARPRYRPAIFFPHLLLIVSISKCHCYGFSQLYF
jgi:hypothetical protein